MNERSVRCKVTIQVLNHEQAANEPVAYTSSILTMDSFNEEWDILRGGPQRDNDTHRTTMRCGLSLQPQTASHLPSLTGMCVSVDWITASDIFDSASSWDSENQSERGGLQAEFVLIFNATDGEILWLMS